MLSIEPPPACRGQYATLTESIPIRLTTDSAKSQFGTTISVDL